MSIPDKKNTVYGFTIEHYRLICRLCFNNGITQNKVDHDITTLSKNVNIHVYMQCVACISLHILCPEGYMLLVRSDLNSQCLLSQRVKLPEKLTAVCSHY